MVSRTRRLLAVGHSYVVALNRRLAHEIQRASAGRWEVTVAAPRWIRGDLRPLALEARADEPCAIEAVSALASGWPHLRFYGAELRRLLARDWTAVHCWEEPFIVAGAQTALLTPPASRLVFYTCQNILKTYPPPFSWLERYAMGRCAGWIGMGETAVETMRARGYGAKPHEAIAPGVDVAAFRPDPAARAALRGALGLGEPGPPVLGFMGRFVPEKGLPALLQALARVRSPWRALIVGEGPLETRLRDWAARSAGTARVVTGVAHAQAPSYLNAMDVLCAPSVTTRGWREQFGRVLIEAFACGVPVLASDSGEIPRVVGDAAVLAPEGDADAWARALERLLESPDARADLARRGLERAHSLYRWEVVARRHLKFLESL